MKRPPKAAGTLVVIPARMGSTRFPGKVLKPLKGLPVVEWCRRAAVRADVGMVVVATDHRKVADEVARHGGASVLTPRGCPSGTDRVHAAARRLERATGKRFASVINLQGDEPLIRSETIRKVARLVRGPGVDIATAVVPVRNRSEAADPNVVKAVLGSDGRCLYFSRSAVPYTDGGRRAPLYRHIGIYGFKRKALARFVSLPPSKLEKAERLEQLRALEAGMTIAAVRMKGRAIAVDTPMDLERVARYVRRRRMKGRA